MSEQRVNRSRRTFLTAFSLVGTAGLLGIGADPVAAEPPPETRRIRLIRIPSICRSPQYIADELLRGQGFTDIEYVRLAGGGASVAALARGEADFSMNYSGPVIVRMDAGDPLVVLGGIHTGCFELFGTDRVRSIRDLKGKTVAVIELKGSEYVFLASMAAYVGLDPRKDINFVAHPVAESIELLAAGKIDAFLGFPPIPQELRARKIGHSVVNSGVDRPWSQYFCCVATTNREFLRRYPVATKRALRAILMANSICALEPDRVARHLVDQGFAERYDYAFQTLKEIPYSRWREFDPEDTFRFYGLRLYEAGLIKTNPNKLIAQGTDWRFLKELKKELK
ncbi:MAG TPA: ABC transporter substrate-binding protein [Methylomirabilota bacterium]|jgi:NitT/TauT family transport system substrate-binding protein